MEQLLQYFLLGLGWVHADPEGSTSTGSGAVRRYKLHKVHVGLDQCLQMHHGCAAAAAAAAGPSTAGAARNQVAWPLLAEPVVLAAIAAHMK